MFSMQEFFSVLNGWWKDLDQHHGNLSISAQKVAEYFVKQGVFTDAEWTRRAFLERAHHQKQTEGSLLTFPVPGLDLITLDDYNLIFLRAIFRELLTQLAKKLKDAMAKTLKSGEVQSMNQQLNNFQRKLMLD
jgi:hypothetical protein